MWWRAALVAVAIVVGGLLAWHAYDDHVTLHRMIGLWNQYGPLLEQARKAQTKPQPIREKGQ